MNDGMIAVPSFGKPSSKKQGVMTSLSTPKFREIRAANGPLISTIFEAFKNGEGAEQKGVLVKRIEPDKRHTIAILKQLGDWVSYWEAETPAARLFIKFRRGFPELTCKEWSALWALQPFSTDVVRVLRPLTALVGPQYSIIMTPYVDLPVAEDKPLKPELANAFWEFRENGQRVIMLNQLNDVNFMNTFNYEEKGKIIVFDPIS